MYKGTRNYLKKVARLLWAAPVIAEWKLLLGHQAKAHEAATLVGRGRARMRVVIALEVQRSRHFHLQFLPDDSLDLWWHFLLVVISDKGWGGLLGRGRGGGGGGGGGGGRRRRRRRRRQIQLLSICPYFYFFKSALLNYSKKFEKRSVNLKVNKSTYPCGADRIV